MHRALRILAVVAVMTAMAACAAPETGEDSSVEDPGSATASVPVASGGIPTDSADGSPETGTADRSRVSIDELLADPSFYADREIDVTENVEEVLVEAQAFLFTGTEADGQLLVVVTPDAPIEKEIEVDRVLTATGMVVPLTAEDLEAVGLPVDDEIVEAVEGNAVLVATAISDPLAGS